MNPAPRPRNDRMVPRPQWGESRRLCVMIALCDDASWSAEFRVRQMSDNAVTREFLMSPLTDDRQITDEFIDKAVKTFRNFMLEVVL